MDLKGVRPLVLFAAIISIAMGVVLQAISGQVDGVGWLGLAVGVGGLALLGMWWWAGRPQPEPAAPPTTAVWYLVAVTVIVMLQFVWFVVWRKFA